MGVISGWLNLIYGLLLLCQLPQVLARLKRIRDNNRFNEDLFSAVNTHYNMSEYDGSCSSSLSKSKSGPNPDIFYINLDKSHHRRMYFEAHLSYYDLLADASRIKASTPESIIIPDELSIPIDCRVLKGSPSAIDYPRLQHRPRGQIFIDALCGRPRNTKRELSVTVSHLQALRTAVHSDSTSPYALIMEDDMKVSFDIDFHALAQSAPKDFAILQLITSNYQNMDYLWKKYTSSKGRFLWEQRSDITDFWCAGVYLINKEVLRPIINRITHKITANGWIGMSIIAGYVCKPSYCCTQVDENDPMNEASTNKKNKFFGGFDYNNHSIDFNKLELNNACMLAPKGYQADHYIFELARPHAYTLAVPLFTGASTGDNSTLHQEQVRRHSVALDGIAAMQKELRAGDVPLPSFAAKCKET